VISEAMSCGGESDHQTRMRDHPWLEEFLSYDFSVMNSFKETRLAFFQDGGKVVDSLQATAKYILFEDTFSKIEYEFGTTFQRLCNAFEEVTGCGGS
jgi:hypothetical protein